MKKILRVIAAATLCIISEASTLAQNRILTVVALDGRNGQPLPMQRLLVFIGRSQEDVQLRGRTIDIKTDENGVAALSIDVSEVKWLQVLVDFRTLCEMKSNQKIFSVSGIISKGLSAPNNCSAVQQDVAPSRLTVFARPATLREKMNW